MKKLIKNILSENYTKAGEIFNKKMDEMIEEKLDHLYQIVANEMFDQLEESHNVQRVGRVKFIRARIRQGKIQRKKKVSNVAGYTMRQGHMVRMSSQERQHRKLAARRSKGQRKAHLRQALIKRRISLRKRRANV